MNERLVIEPYNILNEYGKTNENYNEKSSFLYPSIYEIGFSFAYIHIFFIMLCFLIHDYTF